MLRRFQARHRYLAYKRGMSTTQTANRVRFPHRFVSLFSWALVLTLAFSSCASVNVETRVDESFAPQAARTFAWIRTLRSPAKDVPYEAIRDRVEAELKERGLEMASFADADIYVDYEASVETKMRYTDPYFTVYAGEEVETGNLTISLIKPLPMRSRKLPGLIPFASNGTDKLIILVVLKQVVTAVAVSQIVATVGTEARIRRAIANSFAQDTAVFL